MLDALDPTWINAPGGVGPTYDSEELRRDLGFLLSASTSADVSRTGVLDPRGLTVSLSGSNVQINPGGCAIGTGKGAYLTGAPATATIATLGSTEWPVADATNPRRDRVVLEILDPDNGGGAGRKAQFRVIAGTPSATAASGGGYPPAPTSPSITLFDIDVPRSGNGSPTLTDKRPFTAAAGAPIPVTSKAERDALPKWAGRSAARLDRGGYVDYCDGTGWGSPVEAIDFTIEAGYTFSGSLMKLAYGSTAQARLVGTITRTPGAGAGPDLTAGAWSSVMTTQFIPSGMRPKAGAPAAATVNLSKPIDAGGNPVIVATPVVVIKPNGGLYAKLNSGAYSWLAGDFIYVDMGWPL
jgi:hypothetical protein